MTTEAEIAAGMAIYAMDKGLYGQEWYQLSDGQREYYVTRGAAAVRAYQRAAWRRITPAEPGDRDFLVTHKAFGKWQGPYQSTIDQLISGPVPTNELLICDLTQLPDPVETTDAEL